MESKFKQYKRKGLSEMIPVSEFIENGGDMTKVSVSEPDQETAKSSPVLFEQGYVARNPKNHEDMWYVAKKYFDDNLEPVSEAKTANMSFGQAIEALKAGKRVARQGWNGKGMWLALSAGTPALPAENFWNPHNKQFAIDNGGTAEVLSVITMKTADGKILMGWLASQTDMLAEDWTILD